MCYRMRKWEFHKLFLLTLRQILICRVDYITLNLNLQLGAGVFPFARRATKSRRSLVYHQFQRNCISSTSQEVVYHQDDRNTHLRCDEIQHGYAVLMIYTLTRDDIPSPVGLDKKIRQVETCRIFWPAQRDSNPRSSESESAALSNCATGGYIRVHKHPFII